jgi:cytochrome c oxidase assembly protein subunit 15
MPDSTPFARTPPSSRPRALHAFAVGVAGATLLLVFAGGLVTSTESGLSVPDWPTTYGQNMFTFPVSKWVGGIRYEHVHRLIASGVGTADGRARALAQPARAAPLGAPPRLSRALGAVVAQGLLGGLTVLLLLPPAVSVAHACLAQTFFCIVVTIAVVTSPRWSPPPSVGSLREAFAASPVGPWRP